MVIYEKGFPIMGDRANRAWLMGVAWFVGPAVSAFQKRVRGEQTVLKDHICKEMNGLNLERCRCIPKDQPGADWRVLQQIVDQDPAREKFQVIIAPPS
jgi:hypothetical protein